MESKHCKKENLLLHSVLYILARDSNFRLEVYLSKNNHFNKRNHDTEVVDYRYRTHRVRLTGKSTSVLGGRYMHQGTRDI